MPGGLRLFRAGAGSLLMSGVVALLLAASSIASAAQAPAADSAGAVWSVSGRYGVELDGLVERFGSDSVIDARLDPASPGDDPGTIEDVLLSTRYRGGSAAAAGLLELDVSRQGDWWIGCRSSVLASSSRTRARMDLTGGSRTAIGEVQVENRLHAQGGSESSGAGVQDVASVALRGVRLPGGVTLGLRALGERSWAGEDSLRGLYDYRVFRPSAEIGRRHAGAGDLALRAGFNRKWTFRNARGAFDGPWAEAEWGRWFGFSHHAGLLIRDESRVYARSDSLTPSFQETRVEGRLEVSSPWRLRTSVLPRWSRTSYQVESEIFRDHWSGEVLVRCEAALQDIARGGDIVPGNDPGWNVSLGSRLAMRLSDRRHDSDHRSAGGVIGLSRDAGGRFWVDLAGEAGRRVHRVSGGSRSLVFEGLSISLSGTDYTYVNATVLAEALLGAGIRCELFGMYDQEFHSEAADDFALWSFNVSLTRAF